MRRATSLTCPDEGSIFKTHKYTPLGNTMIGSLVMVYSIPHAGGTLVF
jgi:hypothetical protein